VGGARRITGHHRQVEHGERQEQRDEATTGHVVAETRARRAFMGAPTR
jgi:hypothetical protein